MPTVSSGTSQTFSAGVRDQLFIITANGGALGTVSGAASGTFGPGAERRAYGPFDIGQSITVTVQAGSVIVEYGDASPEVGGGGSLATSQTWASLPSAASSAGQMVRVSDLNDCIYISDGTRWAPMNGRAAIFGQNIPTTGFNSTTETVQVAIPIPAGALQDNDYLTVVFAGNKAAGSDTCNFRARLGTSPTVVGTIGQTNTALATTNLQNQCVWRFQRKSATTLDFPMAGAGVQGTQTTARPAAVTVPNMDTQVTYLQLTLQMTTGAAELAAFQYVQAWHESF